MRKEKGRIWEPERLKAEMKRYRHRAWRRGLRVRRKSLETVEGCVLN
jgi:hypothetical protein